MWIKKRTECWRRSWAEFGSGTLIMHCPTGLPFSVPSWALQEAEKKAALAFWNELNLSEALQQKWPFILFAHRTEAQIVFPLGNQARLQFPSIMQNAFHLTNDFNAHERIRPEFIWDRHWHFEIGCKSMLFIWSVVKWGIVKRIKGKSKQSDRQEAGSKTGTGQSG